MNTPNMLYYAELVNTTQKGKKTPKYTIAAQAGYYPPMEQLRGKDGLISMYLIEKQEDAKSNTPALRLQAKDSLNFTGLKDFFKDGKLSGFAYGYPLNTPVYGKKKTPNPFFAYKNDAFLFVIHQNKEAATEAEKVEICSIELIVLEGAKVLAAAYCKQLIMGGFDEALKALREQAQKV